MLEANSDTPASNLEPVAIPPERSRLASDACFEIEQLARMLRLGSVNGIGSANGIVDSLSLRGVCFRIERLSDLVAAVVNDDDADVLGELASQLGIKCGVPA